MASPSTEYHILQTNEQVEKLKAYLADKDIITLDTETTGVLKSSEIIGYSVCASEDEAYYVITAKWDKDLGKLIYLETKDSAPDMMRFLATKQLVGHNFVFDATMIENNYKVSTIDALHTDTMVLAHLLNENRRIGLKELGKEYFGEEAGDAQKAMKASVIANGGEVTKANYEMYKADPMLMALYGAQDALLTYKLFLTLVPELYEQELEKFFYEDESMPLLKGPTYEMNTAGLEVDTKRLASLKKQLEAECLEAKDFIYKEIAPHIAEKYPGTTKKNHFNIGSSSQLSWLLFGHLGLEFNTLTDAGKEVCRAMGLKLPYVYGAKKTFIATCLQQKDRVYQPETKTLAQIIRAKKIKDPWGYIQCDKKTLAKLAPKFEWIQRLLEYQRKTKILNTYIEGIQERVQYGVIHPSFLQTGTTSGRYSSRNPNFQNLPRDDQRIKECVVARPGKVFVIADQSQLEPRTFASYSQDVRLMAAFDGRSDFYSVVGMGVYNKVDCTPQKEGSPEAFGVKYKKLRDLSKVIALASAYGALAHQLAPTTGKSIDDTQQDIDNYFEEFPGVAKMMTEAHDLAKKYGFVTNIFGRKRRIPEAMKIVKIYGNAKHADLPYEARGLLNLAVNHRIQSTGASIMNRAAIAFCNSRKEANIDCRIVCQVHDELIIECNQEDSENVALLLQYAMENTVTLKGVELEAIPRISKNLAK